MSQISNRIIILSLEKLCSTLAVSISSEACECKENVEREVLYMFWERSTCQRSVNCRRLNLEQSSFLLERQELLPCSGDRVPDTVLDIL